MAMPWYGQMAIQTIGGSSREGSCAFFVGILFPEFCILVLNSEAQDLRRCVLT